MIPMQLATINMYTAHGTSERTNGRTAWQDKTNPKQCEVFCSHLRRRQRYGIENSAWEIWSRFISISFHIQWFMVTLLLMLLLSPPSTSSWSSSSSSSTAHTWIDCTLSTTSENLSSSGRQCARTHTSYSMQNPMGFVRLCIRFVFFHSY